MKTSMIEYLESRLLFTTYYVSTDGSDTADGSREHPWATLQRAAQWAQAGDTVVVLAGHYAGFQTKASGKPDAPITFAAQDGAIIDRPNDTTRDGINLEGASYITVEGFHLTGIPRAAIRSVANDGAKILGNTITDSGMWGILTGFSENVDIEHNTVSGSVKQHGIYVGNSADNPVIRFNTVFNNHQSGIQINSDASQGGDGIITGALVDSNIIFGNGQAGGAAINFDGVQKSTVQNNLLYDNHATGIALYKTDGAEPAKDNVIVNNTIVMASNGRWAVQILDASTGNFVGNNILVNLNRRSGALNVGGDCVPGLVSDYNAGVDRFSNDDDATVLTLSDWKSATGQDAHSIVAGIGQLFADPDSHDFHLAENSPAISTGAHIHAPTKDIEGTTRPSDQSPAPGAYETKKGRMSAGAFEDFHIRRRWIALGAIAAGFSALGSWFLGKTRADRWLIPYIRTTSRRRKPRGSDPVHVMLCIADHYEPQNGDPPRDVALQRVETWAEKYPVLFKDFHDSDGRPPRHSFFYPLEQYDADEMTGIAHLCRQGFGEVEVHLHHDHDTSENLRRRLLKYKQLLSEQHKLLSTHRKTGELMYGFIHGNWALDNSRPDGRWCGVNNELDILRETGCYADFTLPSAPNPTQTRKINSIYYARDNPTKPKSHDTGIDVGSAPRPADSLMLIQGPLLLNWNRRKWGLLPRIENSCIQGNQAPSMARLDLWLRARVQVPARPDWFFVKLHTHGAPESNQKVLLGPAMVNFHEKLAERAAGNPNFHFHYVTAREMYNLVRAAEDGLGGSVTDALDYELIYGEYAAKPRKSSEKIILPDNNLLKSSLT